MSETANKSVLVLTVALALVSIIRFSLRPEVREESAEQIRENIIFNYLLVKNEPGTNFKVLEKSLQEIWKRKPSPVIGQALALIYALENNHARSEEILAAVGEHGKTEILRFALGYTEALPHDWASMLKDDWVDHKTAIMVYEIQKDEKGSARALIHLRHHEKRAQIQTSIGQIDLLISAVGAGLLISMFISSRHWKKHKQRFFKLRPLPIPLNVLYRFIAFLLVGSMTIELIFSNLAIGPVWAVEVLVVFLQISWVYWLIKQQIFHADNDTIADILNIAGLKMRIGYLFQIFGGLAMVRFLENMSDFFVDGVNWPTLQMNTAYYHEVYFQYPIGGLAFLVLACIVQPIFEEIIFRGLIFRSLLAHAKPWPALWGSALIYGVFHPFGTWPMAILMGFGLAVIYYRTNNILINIGVQALRNFLIILITYQGIF